MQYKFLDIEMWGPEVVFVTTSKVTRSEVEALEFEFWSHAMEFNFYSVAGISTVLFSLLSTGI